MQVMADEGHAIERASRIVGVSPNGYYSWLTRAPSQRSIRHAWLTDQIIEIHAASRGTYGARRVHAELTLGRGIQVGHNAVEMLMARANVSGLPGRRNRKKVPRIITAVDLVDRDFSRPEPDRLWVTDITEHPTREGKLYCCVVLDTFSRRVVGWSIDHRQDTALVTNALGMAISNREPKSGSGLVIHSDQGTQFTAWAFTHRARQSGLLPSMGSVGDCFDNAVIESFWGRMQTELLNRKRWTHPGRTSLSNVRIRRGVPQPTTSSQLHRNAHTHRI